MATTRTRCSLFAVLALLVASGAQPTDVVGATPPLQTAWVDAGVRDLLTRAAPTEEITVVVHLREHASLASAGRGTPQQRQRAVEEALRATADASQQALRTHLAARQADGKVRSFEPLWIVNGIIVTATPDVVSEIALRSDVEKITVDDIDIVPAGTPSAPPEPNVAVTNAPTLWNLGFDGQGVVVAALDSGVDINHPDLAPTWRGGTNSWFDPFGQHSTTPTDLSGHGTATMGVIVGGGSGGTTIGVAPGARWIAARVFDDAGNSSAGAIHQAFQWVLDPDGDPATADAPAVVNNSWGFATPGCNLEFQFDVQALRAAAIVPVFSAGNTGPDAATSVSPANYPESLSVGATTNADAIYTYSSRGPSSCGESTTTYPDVVAPGVGIWTTDRFGLFSYWTGTSVAAPAVTGGVALLLSTGPAPPAVESALLGTAADLGATGPDDLFGRGRIDVAAAYQALGPPPPTTSTTTTTVPPTTTTTPPTTTTTTTVPPTTTTSTTTTTVPPTTTTSTTTTTVPLPPDTLFADGFETGTTGAWTSAVTGTGRLTVQTSAALVGSYGLRADIADRRDLYVADATPAAATSYHARFRFDPNSVVIATGKTHDVFHALDRSGTTVITVQVRAATGGYQLRIGSRLRSGSVTYSSWFSVTDAPHTIEVGWQAATTSTGKNGAQRLWLDGTQAQAQTTLANGTTRVDEARLGPQAIPSGVVGAEYFDHFASTVSSAIGV